MIQIQSYQGYFKDGQFMSPQAIKLPENVEVFITITGRKIPTESIEPKSTAQKTLTPEQLEVAKSVMLKVEEITKNGLDNKALEAFKSLENGDFKSSFEVRLP